MNFYLLGAGLNNKGAYLMTLSAMKKLNSWGITNNVGVNFRLWKLVLEHDVDISLVPGRGIRRLGKFENIVGDTASFLSRFFPGSWFGIDFLKEPDVDVILDISGYSFGDIQNMTNMKKFRNQFVGWKDEGKKIILMPQSFGPFERKNIRECMNEIASVVDFIFPREKFSYNALRGIGVAKNKMEMVPDFTKSFIHYSSCESLQKKDKIVIIPNARMVEKTGFSRKEYLGFLRLLTEEALNQRLEIIFLPHQESEDREIVRQLLDDFDKERLKAKFCDTPVEIQEAISEAKLVFSSRYHGLINALNLGIPILGTSWAPKYEELFEFYDISEYLLELGLSQEDIKSKLNVVNDRNEYNRLVQNIEKKNKLRKKRVKKMWRIIESIV